MSKSIYAVDVMVVVAAAVSIISGVAGYTAIM